MTAITPTTSFRPAIATCVALCTAVAAFLVAPSTAEAARKPSVLILRVEGTTVGDKERVALTKALARKARKYKHYRISVSKTDLVEEMFEFECTEAGVSCLSKIGKKYRANLVVYSEVTKADTGGYSWAMRVVQMKSKSSPIARVAQSTVQKIPDLARPKKAAANGLLVLIGPVDLPQTRTVKQGVLHVRLIGGGVALVYVNDKLAGRSSLSGLKINLQPGTYRIKVVRAGYKDWSQSVKIASAKTIDRIVELEPLPRAATKVGNKKVVATPLTQRWYFWAGVVAVGAAVGVTVWALTRETDEQQFGNAAFSLDSNDAHLDPVFGGGS